MYYRVDLTNLSDDEYNDISDLIDGSVKSCQIVPGSKILRVWWESEISLEQYFRLPANCLVSPWRENM